MRMNKKETFHFYKSVHQMRDRILSWWHPIENIPIPMKWFKCGDVPPCSMMVVRITWIFQSLIMISNKLFIGLKMMTVDWHYPLRFSTLHKYTIRLWAQNNFTHFMMHFGHIANASQPWWLSSPVAQFLLVHCWAVVGLVISLQMFRNTWNAAQFYGSNTTTKLLDFEVKCNNQL